MTCASIVDVHKILFETPGPMIKVLTIELTLTSKGVYFRFNTA